MARLKVFISSTHYDLKHVRASLENSISLMGHEAVLSESGKIAYAFDSPLDESCYREVANCDVFVLIVGGRYGSPTSQEAVLKRDADWKSFYTRYESVTKGEFRAAIQHDIPCFVLVDADVYAEYGTYARNLGNDQISYAHVDSVNIFEFLDQILKLARNNALKTFHSFPEIHDWLREQWSGAFRDLLKQKANWQQLQALSSKVSELSSVTDTLKTYLQTLVETQLDETKSVALIREQEEKLSTFRQGLSLATNPLVAFVNESVKDLRLVAKWIERSDSLESFLLLAAEVKPEMKEKEWLSNEPVLQDLNDARRILGLGPVDLQS